MFLGNNYMRDGKNPYLLYEFNRLNRDGLGVDSELDTIDEVVSEDSQKDAAAKVAKEVSDPERVKESPRENEGVSRHNQGGITYSQPSGNASTKVAEKTKESLVESLTPKKGVEKVLSDIDKEAKELIQGLKDDIDDRPYSTFGTFADSQLGTQGVLSLAGQLADMPDEPSKWSGQALGMGTGLALMGPIGMGAGALIGSVFDRPDASEMDYAYATGWHPADSVFGGSWDSRVAQAHANVMNDRFATDLVNRSRAGLGAAGRMGYSDFSGFNPGRSGLNMAGLQAAREGGYSTGGGWGSTGGRGGAPDLGSWGWGDPDSAGWSGPDFSQDANVEIGSDANSQPDTGDSGDSNAGSGGDSVICTHLYKIGRISRQEYVDNLRHMQKTISNQTVRGYHLWGTWFVKMMKKYKTFENIGYYITTRRERAINGKVDVIGGLLRLTLEPLCWVLGLFARESKVDPIYNA